MARYFNRVIVLLAAVIGPAVKRKPLGPARLIFVPPYPSEPRLPVLAFYLSFHKNAGVRPPRLQQTIAGIGPPKDEDNWHTDVMGVWPLEKDFA